MIGIIGKNKWSLYLLRTRNSLALTTFLRQRLVKRIKMLKCNYGVLNNEDCNSLNKVGVY